MMEYCLAVFSTRTSTMQFANLLNRSGVKSIVVETPKAISASCGVSVRFEVGNLERAKEIFKRSGIKNFVRFYYVNDFFGKKTLSPINY